MDVVVVNKMLEEDNQVMEEVNKKLVKQYNVFLFFIGKVQGWRWVWLW